MHFLLFSAIFVSHVDITCCHMAEMIPRLVSFWLGLINFCDYIITISNDLTSLHETPSKQNNHRCAHATEEYPVLNLYLFMCGVTELYALMTI